MSLRPTFIIAAVAAALTVAPAAAQAKPRTTSVRTPQGTITTTTLPGQGGARKMRFKFGPVRINPGQNTISITPNTLRPPTGGYITSFKPDLTYVNGKVPPRRRDPPAPRRVADQAATCPTWAAGEEKTISACRRATAGTTDPTDQWLLNHMIHNLIPTPTRVYIT